MTIAGIDPGLNATGYGVIRTDTQGVAWLSEGGTIRPTLKAPLESRLRELHHGISEVLREYRPDIVVVEELYSKYQHPRTAILMGHARGVVYLAAAELGLAVIGYTASTVKRAVTGSGRASKDQVQLMVQRALRLAEAPQPDHVSDALALALCHANTERPVLGGQFRR